MGIAKWQMGWSPRGRSVSIVCTICARGGSKGVPGKNTALLEGLPLIAHSIKQARQSGLFDGIAVSSDSEEILGVASDFGADWQIRRPSKLASDTAGKLLAIRHCLLEAEERAGKVFEILVDLDVTSPLRLVEDIQGAVQMLQEKNLGNVITGSPARRSPYFNLVEEDENGRIHLSKVPDAPVLRRQAAPAAYDMNASIYVWRRDAFVKNPRVFTPDTGIFVMPEDRSFDIDQPLDFEIVKMIMAQRSKT
jgi:CMP-N,N'-diacetyllegionaminic acid synthase